MTLRWTAAVPRASPAAKVGAVRDALLGERFVSAVDIAVCNGDSLVGIVRLERLLAADAETPLGALIEPALTVGPAADQGVAATAVARAGRRSIAVVDERQGFLGLVPPEQTIAALTHEHEEDMARLGGFLVRTSIARTAAEERVGRRLWHRLPWLGLGLLGAMASAVIVGAFEDQLQQEVLLALFVPAVVYMADAVGTQTEAIVIRGLSAGVPARRVALRELATGLVVGGLIAVAFIPFALLLWGDGGVAVTVGLALFASTSTATVVAMALPYGLDALGRDPAFGSGPLATVIQDLLSILIYFGVAVVIAV